MSAFSLDSKCLHSFLLHRGTLDEDRINGVMLPIITDDTLASRKPGKFQENQGNIYCLYVCISNHSISSLEIYNRINGMGEHTKGKDD